MSIGTKEQERRRIEWRRNQVITLNSQGIHQADTARILKISEPTISRDLYYLKQEAKQTIQNYIDDRLPYEYRKCLEGLDAILRMAWSISSQQNIDSRKKVQALSLAKECYSQKLDLLTNAEVIHNSIKFIENHKQKKAKEQEESEGRIEKLLSSSTFLSTEEEEQEQEEAEREEEEREEEEQEKEEQEQEEEEEAERDKEEEEDEEQEDKEEAEIF